MEETADLDSIIENPRQNKQVTRASRSEKTKESMRERMEIKSTSQNNEAEVSKYEAQRTQAQLKREKLGQELRLKEIEAERLRLENHNLALKKAENEYITLTNGLRMRRDVPIDKLDFIMEKYGHLIPNEANAVQDKESESVSEDQESENDSEDQESENDSEDQESTNDSEEEAVTPEKEVKDLVSSAPPPPPQKKRGRPAGSKNKPKKGSSE